MNRVASGHALRAIVMAALAAFPFAASAQRDPFIINIGFYAEYYRGYAAYPQLGSGGPVLTRVEGAINFSDTGQPRTIPFALPAPLAGAPFTVRWTGVLTLPAAGWHTFFFGSKDDGMMLVDGQPCVNLLGRHPYDERAGRMRLSAGEHFLEIYYASPGNGAAVTLSYAPPGKIQGEPFPTGSLKPRAPFTSAARTIGFDDLPAGVAVTNQYDQQYGVVFVPSADDPQLFLSRPTIRAATGGAKSPPNILHNDSFISDGAFDVRSGGVPLRIRFTRPQLRVACYVGTEYPYQGDQQPPIVMRAYDSSQRVVAADLVTATPQAMTGYLMVSRSVPDIALVSIDFGSVGLQPYTRGERIDDLTIETVSTVPPAADTTPPVISVLQPLAPVVPNATRAVALRFTITEESGAVGSVAATDGRGNQAAISLSSAPGCNAPFCQAYAGVITMPEGPGTVTIRAVDIAGNIATAARSFTVLSRTRVHVTDETGIGVAGAQVYADGALKGTSDGYGWVVITPPLSSGPCW